MPEGPEVRTMVDGLQKYKNSNLKSIKILSGRYKRHCGPNRMKEFLKTLPDKIESINNKGKFVWIQMKSGWSRCQWRAKHRGRRTRRCLHRLPQLLFLCSRCTENEPLHLGADEDRGLAAPRPRRFLLALRLFLPACRGCFSHLLCLRVLPLSLCKQSKRTSADEL